MTLERPFRSASPWYASTSLYQASIGGKYEDLSTLAALALPGPRGYFAGAYLARACSQLDTASADCGFAPLPSRTMSPVRNRLP